VQGGLPGGIRTIRQKWRESRFRDGLKAVVNSPILPPLGRPYTSQFCPRPISEEENFHRRVEQESEPFKGDIPTLGHDRDSGFCAEPHGEEG